MKSVPAPTASVQVTGVASPNYEDSGVLLPGYVNPLAFIEVEEPWITAHPVVPTEEHLRAYLCQPGLGHSLGDIITRYKSISVEDNDRIIIAPPGILERLIWPLRHAKSSFALGNFGGCVALCGMVSEMTAYLIFEASDEHFGRARIARKHLQHFKAGAFERLGQGARTQVLLELGWIDRASKERFDSVRRARNKYLHLFSASLEDLEKDAIEAFLSTVKNVREALGLNVKDGKLILKPEMLAWNQRRS
jgi:hypothetical protein